MCTATHWPEIERRILIVVKRGVRLVAVAFLDTEPGGVKKNLLAGNLPRAALAAGQAFQTIPENHFNCAVGAYTQNIALSPERKKETEHDEEEMYVVLRGGELASVAEALRVISGANLALGDYLLGAARAVAAFRV